MQKKVANSRILKTALEQFSSKGYSETKMTDIAGKAGISVGALYLRFSSKESLCRELIRDQTKDYDGRTRTIAGSNKEALHALNEYIIFCLDFALKKKQLISMFYREHRLQFIKPLRNEFFRTQHALLESILVNGIHDGTIRPLDTRRTAMTIFAAIRGAIMMKLIFGIGSPKDLAESLFDLMSNGLRKDVS